MTIVWTLLGSLAILIAFIVLIGMLLPERYEGRSQVTLAKPPEEVWEALLDYQRHPMTGKMSKGIADESEENGLPIWVEDMGHGERIQVRTIAAEAPNRLVREMASEAVPMTSRWQYELEPIAAGTRLTMDGETTIRRGTWHVPIFRVMMKVNGGVKKGLDIQQDMLAQSLGVQAQRS